jgi:hypothetical protein
MTFRRFVVAAGVLVAAVSCADETQISRLVRTDPSAPYTPADLNQILQTPIEYLSTDIIFDCVFNKANEDSYLPVYTPFSAERHMTLSVWPPGTALWEDQENTSKLVRTLFVRKDIRTSHEVLSLRRFQRFRVKGGVKSHFENTPWIEVYMIESPDDVVEGGYELSATTVSLLAAGEAAVKVKDFAKAKGLLEQAVDIGIPDFAQRRAFLSMARALAQPGPAQSLSEAKVFYQKALDVQHDELLQLEMQKVEKIGSWTPATPQTPTVTPGTQSDPSVKPEVDKLRLELARKEGENASLREKLRAASDPALLDALTRDRDQHRAAREKSDADLKALTQQSAAKITDLENKLRQASTGDGDKVKKLSEELTRAKEDLAKAKEAAVESEKGKYEPMIKQLTETIRKQRADLQELDNSKKQLTADVDALKKENEALKKKAPK